MLRHDVTQMLIGGFCYDVCLKEKDGWYFFLKFERKIYNRLRNLLFGVSVRNIVLYVRYCLYFVHTMTENKI